MDIKEGFLPLKKSSSKDELEKLEQEKFETALTSLVKGETPTDAIYSRKARGGIQVDYVAGWWVIDQLNALFCYDWDFDIVEHEITQKYNQIWVKGRLTVRGDNRVVVTKTQFGSGEVKFYKDQSKGPLDLADDFKAAATDSLKKCASLLGIGRDIYRGNSEIGQDGTGVPKKQLNALYTMGEEKGLTKEDVDKICREKYSMEVKELDSAKTLVLIGELRRREANPKGD